MQTTHSKLPGTFQIFGLTISSEIPLPELCRARGHRADLHVVLDPRIPVVGHETNWIQEYTTPGGDSPWLCLGHASSGYVLRFPSVADFSFSPEARSIGWPAKGTVPAKTLRHVLLDQVIPLALACCGRTILHASAALMRDGVIAFVGDSGSGKSTFAAFLGRAGYPIVTDDSLLLDIGPLGVSAVPSYATLRLWPDGIALSGTRPSRIRVMHGTEKRRVGRLSGLPFASRPAPLNAIYILDPRTTLHRRVETAPISGRQGLFALLAHAYRLGKPSPFGVAGEFAAFSRLIESIPVRRLAFRRGAGSLDSIRETVEREVPGRSVAASEARMGSSNTRVRRARESQ